MQSWHNFLIQIRAFGKKNFWENFEYVFFLILSALLYFVYVICWMLSTSCSKGDRGLLIQLIDILNYLCFHLWLFY